MVVDINTVSSSNARSAKIEISTSPIQQEVTKGAELEPGSMVKAVEEVNKKTEAESKESREELDQLVEDLSGMMSVMRKGLAFKIDDTSGQNVVSVMDIDSGDLIRQIPNEEALKLAEKLTEVTGLLMKTEA